MKKFELVLPVDWNIFDDILDLIKRKESVNDYAWALHPKDELSSFEHYHIGCSLNTSWNFDDILNWFKGFEQIKCNSIEKIKSSFSNYCVYLLHQTKDAINQGKSLPIKFGGSVSFDDILEKYKSRLRIEKICKSILDGQLKEYEFYSNKELLEFVSIGNYTKRIKECFTAYNMSRQLGSDINVRRRQAWIYGLAGSGKTELAKYVCRQFGANDIDIYITSSGSNPFDEYKGQKYVIVDDVDGSTMSPKTALKLLDCFTKSSMCARYNNKYIDAEVVIFTSTKSASSWWKSVANDRVDGNVYQLLRRLNLGSWFVGSDYSVDLSLFDKSGNYLNSLSKKLPDEVIKKIQMPVDDDVLEDIDLVFGGFEKDIASIPKDIDLD